MKWLRKMIDSILIFAAGLIVGWNFLAQPKWVKAIIDKWVKPTE